MAIRKIENEADARACLAAVRAAGGDLGRWTRAHGVDGRSLSAWRANLGRRPTAKRTPTATVKLVELVPAPTKVISDARYVLDLGNVRLEFGDACSTETLQRVLRALRSC